MVGSQSLGLLPKKRNRQYLSMTMSGCSLGQRARLSLNPLTSTESATCRCDRLVSFVCYRSSRRARRGTEMTDSCIHARKTRRHAPTSNQVPGPPKLAPRPPHHPKQKPSLAWRSLSAAELPHAQVLRVVGCSVASRSCAVLVLPSPMLFVSFLLGCPFFRERN